MHLLINDKCVIMYILSSKPEFVEGKGWKISPALIVGDTHLDYVEVKEVAKGIIPFKYLYRDGEFQINPEWKETIDTDVKIKSLEKSLEDLHSQLKGTDPQTLPIAEYKLYMKEKNNLLLSDFLKSHPLLWKNGKYYGVTEEDQNQILGNYNGWKMDQALGIASKLEWNATNEACTEWTEPELLMLISDIYKYAKKMVKLCQHYKVQIVNATTKEEINAIDLVYTEELADQLMSHD